MRPRLALALLVGIALVVVAVAANGASPVPYESRDPADETTPTAVATTAAVAEPGIGPSPAGGFLVVLLAVLGVVALVLFATLLVSALRWTRWRPRGVGPVAAAADPGDLTAPGELVRGARQALAGLRDRTGGPPRDAVVLAWLRLEQAAAESGAAREPHETPTEFTGALLARHHVDGAATAGLRQVYQRARFGVAEVTDEDARAAQDALQRIVHDLTRVREAR
ncbi:DUF4129 domain-containing protein [Saccharothrix algeriensis]|uniref:DUF4129 domain-containing protein n=1 Tax=Saccharothrix algeriensis TaxID=173560 RepID=A0A8T8I3X3_9PSEU|nr:DUF4129 domain-containing protein [Saccharothrix algeriensis]